jgi:hypothetical protein
MPMLSMLQLLIYRAISCYLWLKESQSHCLHNSIDLELVGAEHPVEIGVVHGGVLLLEGLEVLSLSPEKVITIYVLL